MVSENEKRKFEKLVNSRKKHIGLEPKLQQALDKAEEDFEDAKRKFNSCERILRHNGNAIAIINGQIKYAFPKRWERMVKETIEEMIAKDKEMI